MAYFILTFMIPTFASIDETPFQIGQKYKNEFKNYINKTDDKFTYEQMIIIGSQIYGDYWFRIPAMQEIEAYSKAGFLELFQICHLIITV